MEAAPSRDQSLLTGEDHHIFIITGTEGGHGGRWRYLENHRALEPLSGRECSLPAESFDEDGIFDEWFQGLFQAQRWVIRELHVSGDQCKSGASWDDLECEIRWEPSKLELESFPMDLQQFVRSSLLLNFYSDLATLGGEIAQRLPWDSECVLGISRRKEANFEEPFDAFFIFDWARTVEKTKEMDLSDGMKRRLEEGLMQAGGDGFTWEADGDVLRFADKGYPY